MDTPTPMGYISSTVDRRPGWIEGDLGSLGVSLRIRSR